MNFFLQITYVNKKIETLHFNLAMAIHFLRRPRFTFIIKWPIINPHKQWSENLQPPTRASKMLLPIFTCVVFFYSLSTRRDRYSFFFYYPQISFTFTVRLLSEFCLCALQLLAMINWFKAPPKSFVSCPTPIKTLNISITI